MTKKWTSTILLFLVAVGFGGWGISMLANRPSGEDILYAILILICAAYALIMIFMLPRKTAA
jgi:hypothetical protein